MSVSQSDSRQAVEAEIPQRVQDDQLEQRVRHCRRLFTNCVRSSFLVMCSFSLCGSGREIGLSLTLSLSLAFGFGFAFVSDIGNGVALD